MSEKWSNRILYWILMAILPGATGYTIIQFYGSVWFLMFLFVYYLLYRPCINIARLHSLNAIEEKEMWKMFIPPYEDRYWRTLWLG